MAAKGEFGKLLADVAQQPTPAKALSAVTRGALELTGSRNALVAVLNEALGELEIRAGAGREFFEEHIGERLPVDVGQQDGIVAFVAATGSAVMTGNVREEPHYKRIFRNTLSEIAVPIRDRNGRVTAVLNVESDEHNAYTEDDRMVMTALSHLTSMVLEHERHEAREEALIEVGTALDSALTDEALIQRVIEVAEEVLRLEACSIFLVDRATGNFVLRGTIGSLKDRIGQIGYEKGEGFTGWVCETGKPIMLDDPQADPRWRGKYVEFASEQIASFLAVPIVSRNRCIGAIRVLRRKSDNEYLDNRFTYDDLRLLQAIAEQVAVGLENIRSLERMIRSERMIAWGELSAKSSHMIGNRVFALKGDINELRHLLSEDVTDLKSLKEIQASLSTNVQRVEEILQDFRDFVTATQVDLQPTDLNRVIRETVKEVFPRRSEVELQMELTDLPEVKIDEKKARRAISELIENSLNHMDRGCLRVASKLIANTDNDRTKASRISRYAQIEIEDTGPGVEPDQKSIIFQPFFSKRVRGMGLGLSIVKGIVDAHGGEVYEAGEEGAGAKFVILLPLN